MAITISGTNGIVGAGFTVDNSGVSVTAGVGTFSSVQGSGANLTALPAANLTGSLPALSAASLTSIPAANIVGVATAGFNRSGGFPEGVTMADRWHVEDNTNITNASTYYTITGTWAQSDDNGQGGLGSSMTQSGGLFTFPSTGIYMIRYHSVWGAVNASINMWSYITVGSDTTSTTYLDYKASNGASGTMSSSVCSALLDVTNTSTQKIFVRAYSASTGGYISGDTQGRRTHLIFVRLGDT